MRKKTLEEQLSNVSKRKNGCWEWQGCSHHGGYGALCIKGKWASAHRTAYTFWKGIIPKGLCVLHRCDNPSCINPDHLFLGTQADNAKDRNRKGRTSQGESFWRAKLTEKQVRAIRRRRAAGESLASLGREYGLRWQGIQNVVKRKTWKHVI